MENIHANPHQLLGWHLTIRQVTRQAVTQLIMDIIEEKSDKYFQTSLGVSEPDTDWAKPSFY